MPISPRTSLLDRLLRALRRDQKIGVMVNTERGAVVVQVDRRKFKY